MSDVIKVGDKRTGFRKMVDAMENMINEDLEITSLDLRDACYLARLHFEFKNNPRPIVLSNYLIDELRNSKRNLNE